MVLLYMALTLMLAENDAAKATNQALGVAFQDGWIFSPSLPQIFEIKQITVSVGYEAGSHRFASAK